MKILIKFPTKGRKEKFFSVLDKYYELSDDIGSIEFQITIDEDDTTMNNGSVLDKLKTYKNLKIDLGKSENKIHAINRNITVSDWDIILIASDDMIPKVKGYDTIIRDKMKEFYPDTDGILWFHDGNRKDLNTLSIDNEFTQVGNILKRQKFIDQVIIHHEHPDWGFGSRDSLYTSNAKNDSHDRQVYLIRSQKHFDL